MAMVEHALAYAAQGFYVLPLKPREKVPLTAHGLHDATIDQTIINRWWQEYPDANIGLACRRSGFVAIDIDRHRDQDGIALFRELPGWQQSPPGPKACTPHAGYHLLYKLPQLDDSVRFKSSICNGSVDIKSNGYIVVAPSELPDGAYRWLDRQSPLDIEIPELPLWLRPHISVQRVLDRGRPTHAAVHVSRPREEDLVREALRFISSDEYHVWLHVGMALKSAGFPIEMWEEWSESSANYEHGACEQKWLSFRRDEIGLGTLYYYARLAGFRFPPSSFPLDEIGNAARFVAEHGHLFRWFGAGRYWLFWDGTRWARDCKDQALAYAMRTARSILREAADCSDPQISARLASWAKLSASLPKLEGMLKLAHPDLAIEADVLDRHPFLLNCLNGTIDLRTGQLQPHRAEDYITRIVPCDYDPNAAAPRFERFLGEILPEPGLVDFVQHALGYSLTGSVKEHKLFVVYGTGQNGKSTLFNIVRDLLGDYAQESDPGLLSARRTGSGPSEDVARLCGSRLVTTIETNEDVRLDEAKVKQLTGGDRLNARYLFAHSFEFQPTHKLFVITNYKPPISGAAAMWRRMRLIPFRIQISETDRDRDLPEKLKEESKGILSWLVRGCLKWMAEGLPEPPEVENATAEYRSEVDPLERFINECCSRDQAARIASQVLRNRYNEWCHENGELPVSAAVFANRMREKGFANRRTNSHNAWFGIALNQSLPALADEPA